MMHGKMGWSHKGGQSIAAFDFELKSPTYYTQWDQIGPDSSWIWRKTYICTIKSLPLLKLIWQSHRPCPSLPVPIAKKLHSLLRERRLVALATKPLPNAHHQSSAMMNMATDTLTLFLE